MSQNEWRGSLPPLGERRVEFETSFFCISQRALHLEDGTLHPHYTLELGPSAVMLLASTPNETFVINREYRPSTDQVLLSCPGGSLDLGEEPIEGAKRELAEETGYTASRYEVMGSSFPYPGISTQKIYYVCAFDAELTGAPNPDAGEFVETFETDLASLHKIIGAGAGVDGNLCTALYWLSQR